MAIKIPQNNQWKQTNLSDILGSLWSSWNLDLTDKLGVTKITPRTILINDDTTNMGVPAAFEFFNSEWWAVCGSLIFENSGDVDDAFSVDNSSGSPTDCNSDESDLELFNDALYVSSTDAVHKKPLGTEPQTWGASLVTLNTGFNHLLLAFGNRLYVTDAGSRVYSLDTSDASTVSNGPPNTNSNALDLIVYGGALKNTITCMKATTTYIWLGVLNRTKGGKGRVYYWDGAQATPNGYVELDSVGAVAMVIKNDVPWIVDANGALLAFNGGSVTDYGQNILKKVGAIIKAKDDNNAAGADGSMLIGAQYLSDATTTKEGIWIDNAIDTIQKFGYLVTTKIFSQNVDDTWQKLFVRLKKLLASTD